MARVIAELKKHNELVEELCDLDRYRSMTRTAGASFIVEAKAALREGNPDAADILFGAAPAPSWQARRSRRSAPSPDIRCRARTTS